jgi:hypothetical protein
MFRQIKGCGNHILDEKEHKIQGKKHRLRLNKISPNSGLMKSLESSKIQINKQKTI